jgi:hypothetical protein
VHFDSLLRGGFIDELVKIAGWARKGSVPIRAGTVIDKHNKGTLLLRGLKKEKAAKLVKEGAAFVPRRAHHEGTLDIPMRFAQHHEPLSEFERAFQQYLGEHQVKISQLYMPAVPFSVGEPSVPQPRSAIRRKRGDVPSKEDMDAIPKREDGRESATTVQGLGQHTTGIGTSLTPTGEHS